MTLETDGVLYKEQASAVSKTRKMGEVKLFRSWSSMFDLRIVWALKLKGIKYENIYEDLANKSPELLKYNPVHKKVPVLLHDGKPICESLIILEYIDETWKDTAPILPDDPLERAAARFWAKFSDEQIFPSVYRYFMTQGKEQEETKVTALQNLKLVEEQLKGKKFFGGETFGFLDLSLDWLAYYLGIVEEITGLNLLEAGQCPQLCAWMNSFYDIPLIRENCPDHEKVKIKFMEYTMTMVQGSKTAEP